MSDASFSDETGAVRLKGKLTQTGGGPGIPQGGPLTQDLMLGNFVLRGAANIAVLPAQVAAFDEGGGGAGGGASVTAGMGNALQPGGDAVLAGGNGDAGNDDPGYVTAHGGTPGQSGRVTVKSNAARGVAGQALVSDGGTFTVWGGVQIAAAVPMGAPTGLPLAVDTTAVTGGLYVWNGAAWVKVSALP